MEETLAKLKRQKVVSKPTLFNLARATDHARFKSLLTSGSIKQIADDYEEQQRELFGIQHPTQVYAPGFEEAFQKHFRTLSAKRPLSHHGRWVYYPWHHLASHILVEADYYRVRTARNQNLITTEEQAKFYQATIGIAGLSVGSAVAFAIALGGGGKRMKLADMDSLALSNTNRILAGADRLGMRKVDMAARTIYELNPYAEIELFADGLTQKNISTFFSDIDIIVDEIDNLAVKYLIREQAKQRRIPVVMAADNGDNAVVDIERYDQDKRLKFFHNRIGDVTYKELTHLDKLGIGKTITRHIGPENVTERMRQSLTQIGKTIVSWPQLGGAALINGAAVAYCVRKIVNGQPLEKNRALVSLDEKLAPGFTSAREVKRRAKSATVFARHFGL